ncbi:tetratricopeptide repeat protein [Polycladidibacter stylochi]|uniref:tetratricopeptide repeat protein n=1 Tax=Polycladidibacter stylochi TaxID=1807766 RepID=UPI000B1F4483|nr:tetratricopeptide repeat protein [Pseudovibrio stylochi]
MFLEYSQSFVKNSNKNSRYYLRNTFIVLGLLGLASCATTQQKSADNSGHIVRDYKSNSSELSGALQRWSLAYEKDKKNRSAILNYSAALRVNKQGEQAEAILRKGVISHQSDTEISSAYGKVLAENGKLDEALNVFNSALDPTNPDWRILSAKGAILDQQGHHDAARALYRQALKIAPGQPTILNNMGLSFLLAGDLKQAETVLRKAIDEGYGSSRIRQNLALAIGLQGRYDEAMALARAELDPVKAEKNIAYLQMMLKSRKLAQN